MTLRRQLDPPTALPAWVKGETRLSSLLPYVSLMTDRHLPEPVKLIEHDHHRPRLVIARLLRL